MNIERIIIGVGIALIIIGLGFVFTFSPKTLKGD